MGTSNGTLGDGPTCVYLIPQYTGTGWIVGIGYISNGTLGDGPISSMILPHLELLHE